MLPGLFLCVGSRMGLFGWCSMAEIPRLGVRNLANSVVGPGRAGMFVNLIPVYGTILAITFLGENLFSYHVIGTVLVCVGIFLVLRNH